MMGGSPGRTYVSGDTRRAISSRSGRLPNQEIAYVREFGPCNISATSVMPYQLMIAATLGSSSFVLPADHSPRNEHSASSPADAGIIPVVSARCPPDEPPLVMILVKSRLYSFAFLPIHRRAQRQSSTAAGASETFASRYSTFTTAKPISMYGSPSSALCSFSPATQPPP